MNANLDLWIDLLDEMFVKKLLSPHIELMCTAHQMCYRGIRSAEELRLASPKGGCQSVCTQRPCEHLCLSICHPLHRDHAVEEYWCKLPCTQLCSNGHCCNKLCHQKCECDSQCEFPKLCDHIFGDNKVRKT
jgi:hypothetical protein